MTRETQATGDDDIRMVAAIFAGIHDPEAMRRFMDEILTPAEARDLALRWQLLQRLHAGVAQRRIADELGVSLCKITRGSRILKRPGAVTAAILDAQQGVRDEQDELSEQGEQSTVDSEQSTVNSQQ
jgi:TrpR family trp operon transcriptional repressor